MRPRATAELGNLPDPQLFEKVAEGMDHCIRNAVSFFRDARHLARIDRKRSLDVLAGFGLEEIAKYLILLDAIRCPRRQPELGNQLKRFHDHLAKGIYIRVYHGSPADLAEVRRRADEDRAEFYLDGPNDIDWIFRNEILANREESIYVDYVARDEGADWHRPTGRYSRTFTVPHRQKAHRVALCLHAAGFSNPRALALVAEEWRKETFTDSSRWDALRDVNYRTLRRLESAGLLRSESDQVVDDIVNDWLFPLYGLDLRPKKVSVAELRERQANWCPDW